MISLVGREGELDCCILFVDVLEVAIYYIAVLITGFHCRCGEQFCALHRYADKHSCPFDYKTSGREELQRKHPKVVATKVQKL